MLPTGRRSNADLSIPLRRARARCRFCRGGRGHSRATPVSGVQALTQKALMTLPEHIELGDLAGEFGDLVRLGGISNAFARFETLESSGPAPNRHAATHGWAVYDSEQDSLNTIICTDYVYRVATALKERKRRPEVRAASPNLAAGSTSPRPALSLDSLEIPEMPNFDFIEASAP